MGEKRQEFPPYKVVYEPGCGEYEEKKSKFIANVKPVESEEEAVAFIEAMKKKYYDARHNCPAFIIGKNREITRCSDDGEPSGTAGKPILGQINSLELTDVIVLVVRYFGGVKLGTSGLIVAYRTAAAEALSNAEIVDRTVDVEYPFTFEYPFMNGIMKVVREMEARIVSQSYDMDCSMTLSIRKGKLDELKERIRKVVSPF